MWLTAWLAVASPAASAQYVTPAATYFVDGVLGNDSNTGTGPQSGRAFKTLAKLQATLTTGQVGAIAGGSGGQCDSPLTYKEQLTLSVPVTIIGYGGCKPLIDSSDVISAGAWSKTAGRTNIYQATVTVVSGGGVGYLRLWQDGVFLPEVADLATLDSTAGRFYVASNGTLTGTSQTVYVNATDSSNPATSAHVYEINARLYGVLSTITVPIKASNLWTRRNQANNGSFEIGRGSFASDIRADDGTKHNALIHGQSYWQNIAMRDSYYNSGKIALVLNDDSPANWNATIKNVSYVETTGQAGAFLYGHTNLSGQYGTVTVSGCSGSGMSGISGFASAVMVLENCTIDGSVTAGSAVNTIRNVTTTGQISLGYPTTVTLDAVTVTGTFVNGAVRFSNNLAYPAVTIKNSIFSDASPFGGGIYVGTGVTIGQFTLTGNTFLAVPGVVSNHLGGPGTANLPLGTGSVVDGNTYHYPTGVSAYLNYRGTFYDISNLTQWNNWKALGFDANGSRVTP